MSPTLILRPGGARMARRLRRPNDHHWDAPSAEPNSLDGANGEVGSAADAWRIHHQWVPERIFHDADYLSAQWTPRWGHKLSHGTSTSTRFKRFGSGNGGERVLIKLRSLKTRSLCSVNVTPTKVNSTDQGRVSLNMVALVMRSLQQR